MASPRFFCTTTWTPSGPTFVASGYDGEVDQVVIIASDIGDWSIDDMSCTTSPVPEPASAAQMLGGPLALGARARRRA